MRTVTGLFDTYDDARRAVSDLEAAGIPPDDISIVSHRAIDGDSETYVAEGLGAGAGLGALAGGTGGLLAGLGLMAIPGIGPVVAAGWLVATAAGTAAGAVAGGAAGGVIGALIKSGLSEEDANVYVEGVRRGGTMVVAKVSEMDVAVAEDILDNAQRVDVVARGTAYRDAGWSRFDDASPPYTAAEIDEERRRWRVGR
ncbi:hypothetical protein IB238_03960 [Rhizobium sp. ARZ01]|uniref:general stress protein n=1 Tax=Rhizobium sp. ARZ01 TaxID=2769313 RepID=UPI001780A818|nr:general stress protein [Rhizobium sp. ARZ01]MBD9371795.1 hypothetical protein [Rhizobium sp. ARZ01]